MHGVESKIFIGSADRALRKRLRSILQQQGHLIIGEAEDGAGSLRVIRRVLPDLVILDKDLPGMPGMEVSKIIEDDKICPVLLLTPTWEQELFEKAKDSWVFAFLVKPIQEGHLLSTASFVINAFQKMMKLARQVDELKETLETRKIVERAKGILMKNLDLPEAEAYRRIQQQSMDKCLPMKQVAEAIILAYDIKKKK
ncbi:ANTAR domain-containing response regulator [Candidatus Formimonas warabiya]|uniref:Stage 0 sporulation protein A homolog n=1 Tax=Formimonas warabiya TaxID=1761012 RepID=A0A3G1L2B2_FORW1|nr:ANTAR domain-containing protein [Candidatus Formimonas warabiya]ATW28797.1 hypothetical protein DCMF_21370 [Candidatus Formimonas warabiya]